MRPEAPLRSAIPVEIAVSAGGSGRARNFRTRAGPSLIPLRRLGVPLAVPGARRSGDTEEERSSFALDGEGESSPVYRSIYERVDRFLTYPVELYAQGITGTVQATIRFDARGGYASEPSEILSASPYLKVLVAQVLRRAFSEDLPEGLISRLGRDRRVRCHFSFERIEPMNQADQKAKNTRRGNQLSFQRYFIRSALQWKLGPLQGIGPLPNVDLLWFPKKIGELLSKDARIDPLDRYREDPAW